MIHDARTVRSIARITVNAVLLVHAITSHFFLRSVRLSSIIDNPHHTRRQ